MELNETKVLCWNNGGHLIIDDENINSIFCGKSSFTFECWALPDKELVYNKNKMILFGQYDERKRIEYKTMGLYNLDTPSYGSKDEPRPKYIGMRFMKNQLKKPISSSDIVGYHHYAFIYDHILKQRKIYIDGKLEIKDNKNLDKSMVSISSSTGLIMIGHCEYYYWGGIIRDIRIWDTVKTTKEIIKYKDICLINKLSIKQYIINDFIQFIKQCQIFITMGVEIEIIEIIAEYDGAKLCACWPLINDNLYDIVHGIRFNVPKSTVNGEKNPICWIKDVDFLPLGYGQYLSKPLNLFQR